MDYVHAPVEESKVGIFESYIEVPIHRLHCLKFVCVTSVPASQISLNFEKSVPNDPKMALHSTRLKVHHMCVNSIHEY